MNRSEYQKIMRCAGQLDYEIYLNTERLLACQKEPEDLCNPDELQFMIVHQVEELWMKLMATTLLDIDDEMQERHSFKALTLFRRVHMCQEMMTTQLSLLETMSPKDYQEIRLRLGNGSGQESPGFRVLLKMPKDLWRTYTEVYLEGGKRTLEQIYDSVYSHDDAYMVAEVSPKQAGKRGATLVIAPNDRQALRHKIKTNELLCDERKEGFRFSLHGYTSDAEVERLSAILKS